MLSITSMALNQGWSNKRDRVTRKNEILLRLALALALYGLSSVSTPLAGISRNAEDSLYEEVIESHLPFCLLHDKLFFEKPLL